MRGTKTYMQYTSRAEKYTCNIHAGLRGEKKKSGKQKKNRARSEKYTCNIHANGVLPVFLRIRDCMYIACIFSGASRSACILHVYCMYIFEKKLHGKIISPTPSQTSGLLLISKTPHANSSLLHALASTLVREEPKTVAKICVATRPKFKGLHLKFSGAGLFFSALKITCFGEKFDLRQTLFSFSVGVVGDGPFDWSERVFATNADHGCGKNSTSPRGNANFPNFAVQVVLKK